MEYLIVTVVMVGFFIVVIAPVVRIFSVYHYHNPNRKKLRKLYETEGQPIDTQGFTFEQAVGGCGYAVWQIGELDEKIAEIDGRMRIKQNANGKSSNYWDLIYAKGEYKQNENYHESEKNRRYRVYYRRLLKIRIFFPSIDYIMLPPKMIRKEVQTHPWHFNVQPLGSPMYLLQEDFNNALEETHRLYYDLYLPCKRKADELIVDKKNKESELYKSYRDIVALDTDLRNCTPQERINIFKKQIQRMILKKGLAIGIVGTVAMLGAVSIFTGMVNRAGKDIGSGSKWKDIWRDRETGQEYDHNPLL